MSSSPNRVRTTLVAVGLLGAAPPGAHAQHVPTWVVVGVLSPIVVLGLCLALGILVRSVWTGTRHALLVLVWIAMFAVTSYHVDNDLIIWTPLSMYLLHAALLLVLIVVALARRRTERARSGNE